MFRTALVVFALVIMAAAHAGDRPHDVTLRGSDCPHCMLASRDLTNQCLQHADLVGADFDHARLSVACLSYADLHGASLRGADLSGANLAHAKVDDVDFTGAILNITSLRGTDLRHARGLTQAQLDRACGDAQTRLPAGLTVKACN